MKFFKYLLLFSIPAILTAVGIVTYFKLTKKVSNFKIPDIQSFSLSDIVKFSRFSLEKAPSQALVGNILLMEGEVNFEPRLATEAARLSSVREIQQGERLETGIGGSLLLNFKDAAEVVMEEETSVGIIQTLPANIVFSQTTGAAEYKKLSSIPVSIRAKRLLIENEGRIKIAIDAVDPLVTLTVISGTAQVAYNNLANTTQLISLEVGEVLTFNDSTRKAVLE